MTLALLAHRALKVFRVFRVLPVLLAHSPETLEFISLRNTYLDPLHRLQAELLARSRSREAALDSPLEQALLVTVAGIAAGLRNTG